MSKKNIGLIALVTLLIGVFVFLWQSGILAQFNFQGLQTYSTQAQNYTQAHPILAPALFFMAYALVVALSLPAASLMTLLGGFLFGLWFGTALVVTAATLGACLIFLIARSSAGEFLRQKAGGLYTKVEKDMQNNAFSYLLFLRLVPVFPFFLVNILPALFNVKLRDYALTTLIGILPGSFVYVNVGRSLGSLKSASDLISPSTLIAFGMLGVLALIPTLIKKFKNRNGAAV